MSRNPLPLTLMRTAHRHASFLVIIGGSVSMYVTSVASAYVLSAEDFVALTIFMSLAMIASTFATFGLDQVVTRQSEIGERARWRPEGFKRYHLLASCCFTILLTILASWVLGPSYAAPACLTGAASARLIRLYTNARLEERYVSAQLHKNAWKIVMCGAFAGAWVVGENAPLVGQEFSVNANTLAWLVSLSATATAVLFRDSKTIEGPRPISSPRLQKELWPEFLISMAMVTALTHGDRFLLSGNAEATSAAAYFFAHSLILAPLAQLQNYIGFRDLVAFKRSASSQLLDRVLANASIVALPLVVALPVGLLLAEEIFPGVLPYKPSLAILLLLAATGIIRVLYSAVSAAMGAIGTASMIRRANLSTLLVAVGVVIAASRAPSVLLVCSGVLALWVVRFLHFYFELLRSDALRNPALAVPTN